MFTYLSDAYFYRSKKKRKEKATTVRFPNRRLPERPLPRHTHPRHMKAGGKGAPWEVKGFSRRGRVTEEESEIKFTINMYET